MSKFANKYNKGSKFLAKATGNEGYLNLKECFEKFADETQMVLALYINTKSKFGNAPVLLSNGFLVNLPSHLLETVQEMMEDEELVQAINECKFGFKVYQYDGKNGKGFSVRWVDLD